MIDRVNVQQKVAVLVRPFMQRALNHSEIRLQEKDAEKLGTDWNTSDFYRFVCIAHNKLSDFLSADFDDVEKAKLDIVDAINLLGMAYDNIEQGQRVEVTEININCDDEALSEGRDKYGI